MKLLEIKGLTARYNAGEVLKGLDLTVEQGEIVALLGSNGAGKSTTLRSICGLVPKVSGEVLFNGEPILGRKPEAIAKLGIAHVPEGRRLFPGLTVRDNIMLGASSRGRVSGAELKRDADALFDFFPDLKRFERAYCWSLSGGQMQMVAVARGLMAKPKLLLLDEPSLGLAPLIVQQVFRIIAQIRETGTTVLLVEQNANVALSVADRGYVLEAGQLLVSGKSADLWDNDQVRAAYLGGHAIAASAEA
jgi:branched-chain amino acid transport system ATP-binding protein